VAWPLTSAVPKVGAACLEEATGGRDDQSRTRKVALGDCHRFYGTPWAHRNVSSIRGSWAGSTRT
jgi:hypothetical protein